MYLSCLWCTFTLVSHNSHSCMRSPFMFDNVCNYVKDCSPNDTPSVCGLLFAALGTADNRLEEQPLSVGVLYMVL